MWRFPAIKYTTEAYLVNEELWLSLGPDEHIDWLLFSLWFALEDALSVAEMVVRSKKHKTAGAFREVWLAQRFSG